MKTIQFLKCLFIELMSEIDEAMADRAKFKEIEQMTGSGWND